MIAFDEPNQVARRHACPDCGERDVDCLVWPDDEETVRCVTCGREYRPGEE